MVTYVNGSQASLLPAPSIFIDVRTNEEQKERTEIGLAINNHGLSSLSDELTVETLSYLDPRNLAKIGRLNRSFFSLSKTITLWEDLFKKEVRLPIYVHLSNQDLLSRAQQFAAEREDLCKESFSREVKSPVNIQAFYAKVYGFPMKKRIAYLKGGDLAKKIHLIMRSLFFVTPLIPAILSFIKSEEDSKAPIAFALPLSTQIVMSVLCLIPPPSLYLCQCLDLQGRVQIYEKCHRLITGTIGLCLLLQTTVNFIFKFPNDFSKAHLASNIACLLSAAIPSKCVTDAYRKLSGNANIILLHTNNYYAQ